MIDVVQEILRENPDPSNKRRRDVCDMVIQHTLPKFSEDNNILQLAKFLYARDISVLRNTLRIVHQVADRMNAKVYSSSESDFWINLPDAIQNTATVFVRPTQEFHNCGDCFYRDFIFVLVRLLMIARQRITGCESMEATIKYAFCDQLRKTVNLLSLKNAVAKHLKTHNASMEQSLLDHLYTEIETLEIFFPSPERRKSRASLAYPKVAKKMKDMDAHEFVSHGWFLIAKVCLQE